MKVKGRYLRSTKFFVRSTSEENSNDQEINSPSLLVNLLKVRGKLREEYIDECGFGYQFPLSLDFASETNGFRATFPIIFE